jgi:hypothetical protein
MFDKLEKLSKVSVFLGVVLYFFGFITFNSFLSRFGMVSFDVVNSRFVFAGFFSCLSVGLMILIGWTMAREMPLKGFFKTDKISRKLRVFRFAKVPAYIFFANYFLFAVLSLGKYVERSKKSELKFAHIFGDRDFFGKYLESKSFGLVGGIDYSLKYALYSFVYFLVFGFVIYFFVYIYQRNKIENKSKTPPNATTQVEENDLVPFPLFARYLYAVFDLTMIVFFTTMVIYCSKRLFMEVVDFTSFEEGFDLSLQNVFVWFFPNVMFVYFMFHAKAVRILSGEKPGELLKIDNLYEIIFAAGYYFIPVVVALVTFGQVIFPKIPFAVGGGQPRRVTLETLDKKAFGEGEIFVLGESSQYFFLADIGNEKSSAFQINKNEIRYLETAEKSTDLKNRQRNNDKVNEVSGQH